MSNHQTTFVEQMESLGALIDAELARLLSRPDPVANLHDAALYSMGLDVEDRRVRGKRVRPVLSLLTGEALGIGVQRPLAFACAIELLHNFALVHDDIEDGDLVRRGRPAVHERYGLAHGINTGDYLFAKVFSTIAADEANPPEIRAALLDLINETLEFLFIGQCLDINARASRPFAMEEYNRLVDNKTGSYLAAPMLGSALMAGCCAEEMEALRRFGRAMGPLFQIKDDLIDLTTGKGRDEIGNDIREGKRSYLVAAFCEAAPREEQEQLFDILDLPREETSPNHVARAVALFQKHGIMAMGEARCRELLEQAMATTAALPPALGEMLRTMATFLTSRKE